MCCLLDALDDLAQLRNELIVSSLQIGEPSQHLFELCGELLIGGLGI